MGSAARTDLCGGRSAMIVPTATFICFICPIRPPRVGSLLWYGTIVVSCGWRNAPTRYLPTCFENSSIGSPRASAVAHSPKLWNLGSPTGNAKNFDNLSSKDVKR